MLNIQDLSMRYGAKILFENVNLMLSAGKRYGLIGANGAGKSTLLRIITGEESATSGTVAVPREAIIGFLKQDQFRYENTRILDVVIAGNEKLSQALAEKETLLAETAHTEASGYRLGELEEIIAGENGYMAEAVAAEILVVLGIETRFHEGSLKALSGGFKLRVLLAQVLFQAPDILLLDEPTNHLDILSIRWLENYLRAQFAGCLIFISHDRDFLDATSTHILDIDYGDVTAYTGNYSRALWEKAQALEQKEKQKAGQERRIAELQTFVDRFGAKASKARQAQSKQKQIDRIQVTQIGDSSRIAPKFMFTQKRPSGKEVLRIEDLSKQFGEKTVLKNVNLTVMRGEKIAILGPNGVGKSTLLKILLNYLPPSSGEFEWGYEAQVSYFAQDHHEQLHGNLTAFAWLQQFAHQETETEVRGILGRMLFSGDDAYKSIPNLSGGEAARLLLAKMMMEKANILVLDEPTNHLDLESIDALAAALKKFPGTVLSVSHDRHFVANFATRIVELMPAAVRDFHCDYAEYVERFGVDHLNPDIAVKKVAKPAKAETPRAIPKNNDRDRSGLEKKLAKLQQQIEDNEAKIAAIDAQFVEPDFFTRTSPTVIDKLTREKSQWEDKVAELTAEWERVVQALE